MTDPMAAPCHINTTKGQSFVVKDINAWTYINSDWVQADGYWADDPARQDRDVLIPAASIHHITVHYDELDTYMAAQAAEPEEVTCEITSS